MPIFLNPRFALLLLVALPVAGGAAVHPQGASAFVMGAWAGFLLSAPPLFIVMWLLGLRTIGQLLRPLVKLPILIVLTVVLLYAAGVDLGAEIKAAGLVAGLWWAKRGRALF